MSRRTFTDDDLGYIADSMDRPRADVAAFLGVDNDAVSNMRRLIKSGWSRKKSRWTAEEDEFIRRNQTMSVNQMSSNLPGRTYDAVAARVSYLGLNIGNHKRDPMALGMRTMLAKTCPRCGLLLPPEWFFLNKKKGFYRRECKKCDSQTTMERRPDDKRRNNERLIEYAKRAQEISLETADKKGCEYTEADHAVLADESLTRLSKALILHRTYQGVSNTIFSNGYKSKGSRLGNPQRDRWLIDNPNASRVDEITAALKQEFTDAGIQFPEWDWDDEDLKETA